jgi:hypothetical protein
VRASRLSPDDTLPATFVERLKESGLYGRLRLTSTLAREPDKEARRSMANRQTSAVAFCQTRSCRMMLKYSSIEGGSKYAVIASNSASVVHAVPAGRSLLRSFS